MSFEYNPKTHTVECDEADASLEFLGQPRERGQEFLLRCDGKKIGFRTSQAEQGEVVEWNAEGSSVWWFDVIFCKLVRRDFDRRRDVTLTDTYSCSSREELEHILSVFMELFSHFDRRLPGKEKPQHTTQAKFTRRVLDQIQAGVFVT